MLGLYIYRRVLAISKDYNFSHLSYSNLLKGMFLVGVSMSVECSRSSLLLRCSYFHLNFLFFKKMPFQNLAYHY